ncbi:hypothetical protein ACTXT7_003337 [Hymenolepis weldensis]
MTEVTGSISMGEYPDTQRYQLTEPPWSDSSRLPSILKIYISFDSLKITPLSSSLRHTTMHRCYITASPTSCPQLWLPLYLSV